MVGKKLQTQFGITKVEIKQREKFLGFDQNDGRNLRQIHEIVKQEAEPIIEAFYAHLMQFEELKERFFFDRAVLQRLKKTQRQYLAELGCGMTSPRYFERGLRIGITHERVGLEPKWYLGAYSKLFEIIGDKLTNHLKGKPEQLSALLITLQKVFALDSILAVETYYDTIVRRLKDALASLEKIEKKLRQTSRTDGLTKINNRPFLLERLMQEFHASRLDRRSFTLLFADLDHFKKVNDRCGHAFGDIVLAQTVSLIRSTLRPKDVIGRYGGEEFLVGLVDTNERAARQVAERIRQKIQNARFEKRTKKARLTISLGVATLTSDCPSLADLIERADEALYRAKDAGRNCVV